MPEPESSSPNLQRQLNAFDGASVVIGIIIGAGIYKSSPMVAQNVSSPGQLFAVWIVGGLISLVGALCYAELASRVKQPGGEYAYLKHGYGRSMAFLFAWAQYWIIRPGSIGAMAYVFAVYSLDLLPFSPGKYGIVGMASIAVISLTLANALGVKFGKWTQNVLTLAKVLGIIAVLTVAFVMISPAESMPVEVPENSITYQSLSFAFIMVMFSFGGWNDMTYIAAEIKEPRKNILRALLIGNGTVLLIYLLLNAAFIYGLGFPGFQKSELVASDLLQLRFPAIGGKAISLLVAISCLGAMQGMIWTGSRLYYVFGQDFSLFKALGHWNTKLNTPLRSLIGQAIITLTLIYAFGPDQQGFGKMVVFTTPAFWFFLTSIGLSLFWFRRQSRPSPDVYEIPLYPWTPILFCLASLFMFWSSFNYAWGERSLEALWSILLFAIGILFTVIVVLSPEKNSGEHDSTDSSSNS